MKQVTQRQKDELARRKAMPIALIQRPLKFIAANDVTLVTGTDGVQRKVLGDDYVWARYCADAGRGREVQQAARAYL